jgi:hypothetical protein
MLSQKQAEVEAALYGTNYNYLEASGSNCRILDIDEWRSRSGQSEMGGVSDEDCGRPKK